MEGVDDVSSFAGVLGSFVHPSYCGPHRLTLGLIVSSFFVGQFVTSLLWVRGDSQRVLP